MYVYAFVYAFGCGCVGTRETKEGGRGSRDESADTSPVFCQNGKNQTKKKLTPCAGGFVGADRPAGCDFFLASSSFRNL